MMSQHDLQGLRYILSRFMRPYWKQIGLLLVLSLSAAFTLSIQPLTVAPAMEVVLGSEATPATGLDDLSLNNLGQTLLALFGVDASQPLQVVLLSAGLFTAVAVLTAILSFSAYMLSVWIIATVRHAIQVALYEHITSFSLAFFVRQRTGDIVSRFTNDAVQASQIFETAVRQTLQSVVLVSVYSWLLFRTDWRLALATLLVSMLHLAITQALRDQIRNRTADQFGALGEVSTQVQESVLSMRIIKSFASEQFETARLAASAERLRQINLRYGIYKHIEDPLRMVTNALAISVVMLMAFWVLVAGQITAQGFILFVLLARQTITPAAQLGQALLKLQEGIGAAQRVLSVFEQQPDLVDGTQPAPPLREAIRLERVMFGYLPDRPVLQQIDLEIRRGEVVALVGPSGAGKSTLADLVLRLYDPDSGRVLLDGQDVRGFTQTSYRQMFGVVSQEALLFHATIAENIAYGRPIILDDVQRAARIANAEEFITDLPDGYETLVGDRGIRLSGGQRQRIAIARAIYARPAVLVLDEATSALDTNSEHLVQQAIDRVLEDTTALVIAHRLSTIINADKIVVLRDGNIEAIGTHHELLASSPLYHHLYTLQTSGAQSATLLALAQKEPTP